MGSSDFRVISLDENRARVDGATAFDVCLGARATEGARRKRKSRQLGGSLRPWPLHWVLPQWQAQVISGPLASWISVVIGIVHHCPALRRVVVLAV